VGAGVSLVRTNGNSTQYYRLSVLIAATAYSEELDDLEEMKISVGRGCGANNILLLEYIYFGIASTMER
jgi:hypothetical protein